MKSRLIWRKSIFLLILIFTLTLIIIGNNKIVEETSASTESTTQVQVTYKPGDGTGTEVTVTQSVYDKQTQGTNDYTDNKIILYSNGDTTSDGQEINFDGGTVDYNGTTYETVLTGWELTAVCQDGTTFTKFVEPENQNYADPSNAQKDINTVYAQKGWYIVPDGVTSIEVTAVYGRAIYIRSPYDTMYYDEYHIFYYGENSDGTTSLDGTATEKSSDDNDGSSEETPVATLKRAYELITADSSLTVYDTVIVLCGDLYEINYVSAGASYATGTAGTYQKYTSGAFGYTTSTQKPVTIASKLGETYYLYYAAPSYDITNYSSLRLDNLKLCDIPQANLKDIRGTSVTISTYVRTRQFNFNTAGTTFETTETVTSDATKQIRYKNAKSMKFNGGQWNPVWQYSVATGTLTDGNYIQIGGLAAISYVTTQGSYNSSTTEYYLTNPATINVLGGKFTVGIYGTGYALGGSIKGNVYINISGGYIPNIYGGGNGSTYANGSEKGDVNINIYGGQFGDIYGAGQYYTSNISGDVNLNINNATISSATISTSVKTANGNIYGGGKGGSISGDVNLTIDNSTISGTVFGGGLGLTDNISFNVANSSKATSSGWDAAVSTYNTAASKAGTVSWSEAPNGFPVYDVTNKEVITRKYHQSSTSNGSYYLYEYGKKSSLTLAEITGNITVNISNSTISTNVYGGGSISAVDGNIEVNVEESTVSGNIYGGGDGATTPGKVDIYSQIYSDYTVITASGKSDTNTKLGSFTWTADEDILTYFNGIYDGVNKCVYNSDNTKTSFDDLGEEAQAVITKYGTKQLVYSADAERLGEVGGNVTLTVSDSTVSTSSIVCGGGNAGEVEGDITQTIDSVTNLSKVYGGGYQGDVDGSAKTQIVSGDIDYVYGGGYSGTIGASSTVIITSGNVDYVYGGGYSGSVGVNTEVTIESGTFEEVFGGGYSGITGGDSSVIIKKGTFTNVFGGADQSYITGNTTVIIGDDGDLGITVSGVVYGGGRGYDEDSDGDASDFITVYGNSTVTIQGINTNVGNYGSVTLGAVKGTIDVTFKNYSTGNSTSPYKTMNGIDRATNVYFDNSYVLLTNKDSSGNVIGIKSIENLNIPSGSGLKISADGEISGDFNGGGELYLDSEVCLTVGGKITGHTKLVLNPVLTDGSYMIQGGEDKPYMVVSGSTVEDSEETTGQVALALQSEDSRYTILYADDGEATKYYIAETITIDNSITDIVTLKEGRIYSGTIEETEDTIYIMQDGIVTCDVSTDYQFKKADEKYESLSRNIIIKSGTSQINIPQGTKITMVVDVDGETKYYQYTASEDVAKVSLGEFVEIGNTENSYVEETNIDSVATVDAIGANCTYSESFRFIIDFSESEKFLEENKPYNILLDKTDGGNTIDELTTISNMMNVLKRDISYDINADKTVYSKNGTIELTGKVTLTDFSENNGVTYEDEAKKLAIMMYLKDSEGNKVDLPVGTIISVNGTVCRTISNSAIYELLDIVTTAQSTDANISFDMSKIALESEYLVVGTYSLCADLCIMQDDVIQKVAISNSFEFTIVEDFECGIDAEFKNDSENSDKFQLFKDDNKSKTLQITIDKGNLSEANIKISLQKKSGEFAYEDIENTITETEILDVGTGTKDVTVDASGLDRGIYRLVLDLYDESEIKCAEKVINFYVK